jgi:putative transcriptional regulator
MGRSKTETKNLKLLGQRLKKIRIEKRLSLNQLGLIIDKDRQSIHRIEKGNVDVGFLYLLKLCEGLEIDISDLLKDLE